MRCVTDVYLARGSERKLALVELSETYLWVFSYLCCGLTDTLMPKALFYMKQWYEAMMLHDHDAQFSRITMTTLWPRTWCVVHIAR